MRLRHRGPDYATLRRKSPFPIWAQIGWRVSLVVGLLLFAILLHWFERATGDLAFIDQGAPGPSIGDRLVYSAAIFDTNGQRIGRDAADCIIVRVDPSEPPARQQVVQCSISVELPDGQLTVQGLAQGTENYFAITGGTGAYRTARGEVLARDIVPLQEAEITVFLYR